MVTRTPQRQFGVLVEVISLSKNWENFRYQNCYQRNTKIKIYGRFCERKTEKYIKTIIFRSYYCKKLYQTLSNKTTKKNFMHYSIFEI